MKKTRGIGALAVLSALALCTACAGPAGGSSGSKTGDAHKDAHKLVSVSYAVTAPTASEWGSFIADRKGFFEKNGLKVKTSFAGSVNNVGQQLVGGSFEIGTTNTDTMIRAVDAGAPIVAIGSPILKFPFRILADKDIHGAKGLEGKTVSLASAGGISSILTQKWLADSDVDVDGVKFVYSGGSPQRYAALVSGTAQAAILTQPFDFTALDAGYKTIVDMGTYAKDYGFECFIVRKDWLSKNGDIARKWLKAYAEALAWLKDPKNEKEAVAILSEATSQDESVSQAVYDYYVKELKPFPKNVNLPESRIDGTLAILKSTGYKGGAGRTASSYLDLSYLPK